LKSSNNSEENSTQALQNSQAAAVQINSKVLKSNGQVTTFKPENQTMTMICTIERSL
jgi:hypothetical protein